MTCIECPNREGCIKPCAAVEKLLQELHSLKSNYLVKFVDPGIIESICVANYVHKPSRRKVRLHKTLLLAIEKLPPSQKKCVEIYYGFSNGEFQTQAKVAKILSCTQKTISYRLHKARVELLRVIASKMIV